MSDDEKHGHIHLNDFSGRKWSNRSSTRKKKSPNNVSKSADYNINDQLEVLIDSNEIVNDVSMITGNTGYSPSPQDIRILHNLVENIEKEQDEHDKIKGNEVRAIFHHFLFFFILFSFLYKYEILLLLCEKIFEFLIL